ncbi:hypothetical protein ABZR88_09495 [Mucilaginibacter yixingensis]|uniref:hypothetical protein n=1 Tax=Mucilaginibacter yixingensis TaxID=1295612 RepID=UPI0011B23A05|nr:hypothetical protein [Mucilaginibacter yixingensis]
MSIFKSNRLIIVFTTALLNALLLACSCHSKNSTKVDKFYTDKGEWDSARLPLIKPYEAIIVSKESGWSVNLDGLDGDTGFQNTDKVNVLNGVILLHSVNSILHGVDSIKETWHIIVPAKHLEKGFATHADYSNYIKQLGIKQEPKLHDINLVAAYYEDHDIINWNAIDY